MARDVFLVFLAVQTVSILSFSLSFIFNDYVFLVFIKLSEGGCSLFRISQFQVTPTSVTMMKCYYL